MVAALERADVPALGQLMDASHASLRDDFAVSVVELDTAVEPARAAGAVGARMTGGGFGGCAIAVVPAARLGEVGDAVRRAAADRGLCRPELYEVVAGDGAHRTA